MKKYIYMLINQINNKKYIGQSNNPKRRFNEHANSKEDYPITNAIKKYGKENFKLILLTKSPVEDYNEQEKNFISSYNTKIPYGYNIGDGGEEPPIFAGENNNKATHTKEEINEIKRLLKCTNLPFRAIAKKFNYTGTSSIGLINEGYIWKEENEIYPLRRRKKSDLLSSLTISQIVSDLINTNESQEKIAKKYGVKRNIVTAINLGESYKEEGRTYPLRKQTKQYRQINSQKLKFICAELKDTKKSFVQIAKENNVSIATVSNINNGKHHLQIEEAYPLRKK